MCLSNWVEACWEGVRVRIEVQPWGNLGRKVGASQSRKVRSLGSTHMVRSKMNMSYQHVIFFTPVRTHLRIKGGTINNHAGTTYVN